MVCVIDGMDQAKTSIPHQVRNSKDTDGIPGLGVHVVSAFAFGGASPIMGFLNLPDISKNSSLSVMNIHRAIDLQFEEHLKKNDGKLITWPKRFHVVFDNAVGENINSNVFSYLALLVHSGVFLEVSISTLLVGHTHNINDQLFSVWSRWLNNHDCITLSQMMEAFSQNYRGWSTQKEDVAANDANVLNPPTTLNDETESVISSVYMHIPKDAPQPFQDEMKHSRIKIKQDIVEAGKIATPYMEHIKRNVNVGGWLADKLKADNTELKKKYNTDHPHSKDSSELYSLFENIRKYHVFMFFKNPTTGDTEMFTKFEAQSHIRYDTPHPIEHNGEKYRKRRIIIPKSRVITDDPLALPFNFVDVSSIITLLDQLGTEDKKNEALQSNIIEMKNICAQLTTQYSTQSENCSECEKYTTQLKEIGTLHKPKNGDDKLVDEHNASVKNRSSIQVKLHEHLKDDKYRSQHSMLKGWWTEWVNNRIPMIQKYYLDTLPVDTIGLSGLLSHPADQTKEEMCAKNRVESDCMKLHGEPKKGDFVLTRAIREKNKPPFWLSKIKKFFSPSNEVIEYYQNLKACHTYRMNHPRYKPSDPQAKLPTKPANMLLEESNEESKDNEESYKTREKIKRGKDQLQVGNGRQLESIYTHTHLLIQWYTHLNESATKVAGKRKAPTSTIINKTTTETESSTKTKKSSRKKQRVDYNETKDEDEDEQDQNDAEKDDMEYENDENETESKMDDVDEDDKVLSSIIPSSAAATSIAQPSAESSNSAVESILQPAVESSNVLLDPWRNLKYTPCNEQALKEDLIDVSTLIWWGTNSALFKSDKTLSNQTWVKLIQDFNQGEVNL